MVQAAGQGTAPAHERDRTPASVRVERRPDVTVVTLAGRLDMAGTARIWPEVRGIQVSSPCVAVQADAVTYCDSSGVALLYDLECRTTRAGKTFELHGFPEDFQPLLDMFTAKDFDCAAGAAPRPKSLPEAIGATVVAGLQDLVSLVGYVGELVLALLYAAVHPGKVRWKDTFRVAQNAGVAALPVVMLIGGLIGLVLGFQSAITLRRFGADTFLANFVGLSMVRELGPLMTAVVLAARSGSSFAAELGTMKVQEEIDALSTMGLDPVRFLLTPRVIAAVVMTPLLTAFSTAAGLGGGAIVSVFTLDLPLSIYTNKLQEILAPQDVIGGIAKAFVFGILVTGVGCIRGLQTSGGAIGVGVSTTRAVVSGIILIAVTDSLFSFLYYALGI